MGHTGGCWGGGSVVVAVVKTGLQLLPSEWQWFTAWSMHATPLRVARAAAAAAALVVQPPPPTTESSYSSSSSAHYWTNTELQSDRSGGFRPRLRRRPSARACSKTQSRPSDSHEEDKTPTTTKVLHHPWSTPKNQNTTTKKEEKKSWKEKKRENIPLYIIATNGPPCLWGCDTHHIISS